MEKILEQTLLYDFYGELLTRHQKEIYEDVVLNDYSYSEVAEERGISRQGVHDLIKRCHRILQEYEEKLHLVEKFVSIRKQIQETRQFIRESESVDRTLLEQQLEEIIRQL
ncbi:MAG: DNA-binding protein [Lachnospiraceae bacterium]|nr:DNA-binding protein [Lachnospiraceae bacterium]